MKTKSLLLALTAIGMLVSCAEIMPRGGPPGLPPGCDGHAHVCKVTVNVSSCGGYVTATPNTRHVPRGTWVIQWEVSPGYEFAPRDGIAFKTAPGGIFTGGHGSGNHYQWVDNNNAEGGPYKYDVHILKNGAECAKYDPDVYND